MIDSDDMGPEFMGKLVPPNYLNGVSFLNLDNYFTILKVSKIFPLWDMNCPIRDLSLITIFVKP